MKDIPDVVVDPSTGKRYMKGKFLGKVCQNTLDQIHFQHFVLVQRNFNVIDF